MKLESKQPLTDAEREITRTVVQRFHKNDEATAQRFLLRELVPFRASITGALRTLTSCSVLNVVNNSYGEETYSPRAIAFHYCGDANALAFAKKSTEIVLRVVQILYERELETDAKDQKPFTREDTELEARKIDPSVGEDTIRVGLALAEEFGVFRTLQRNSQQIGVMCFLPGQHIFELGKNPWEDHIRRSSVSVEGPLEQSQSESSENTLPPYSAMVGLEASAVELDNRKIFLVHGHADETKHAVAKFLRSLGLEVIILHEQANQGQTIVEKFEKYADVGFAVVLLTPDDFGGSVEHPEKTQRRARQNVILELGIFIGKLGRKRVCPLYVEGVELPSDIHGVLYVSYDHGGAWRSKLMKELSAAGIEVDQSTEKTSQLKSLRPYIKPS